jgi:hypothetical protein
MQHVDQHYNALEGNSSNTNVYAMGGASKNLIQNSYKLPIGVGLLQSPPHLIN